MAAAQNGHANVVNTLLQHEASVDMKQTVSVQNTEPWYLSKYMAIHKHCTVHLCRLCNAFTWNGMIPHSLCLLYTLTIIFVKASANCRFHNTYVYTNKI